MNGHRHLLRALLAGLALAAAAPTAGALFEDHLDPFGVLVADRLSALPETGGTATEAKQRKALLKAAAALAAESTDRVGDLKAAKKAAAAVQKALALDAGLLGALEDGLDAYRSEADDDLLACDGLLADFPEGALATKLGKKLLAVENVLLKDDEATVPSVRAGLVGKAHKKLVPIKEALEEGPPGGPCPPPSIYDVDVGTVTCKIGVEPWTSTDLNVILIVDSDSMAVIQLGLSASRPDGEGGTLDTIDFIFDNDDFTGPGTYSFNTSTEYILAMNYIPAGPGSTFQATSGTVTITEFSFDPTDANPDIAGGRLAGTFSFFGCTTYYPSGVCESPDTGVSVTEGTFEVCNFDVIYY
jgi:hypothetical protein